jgi:PAS domain S-box-containing protein
MKHAEVESPMMLPGDSLVPLESILCTGELNRRPSRAPDYQADRCALVALAQALADSPRTILQTMAEMMLEIFQCDSAGFSLLTKDGKNFYWPAIAGMWQPHIGGGTPRNFGPCGDVLDCNRPLLFSHWERRYPYLLAAMPMAEEGLLVPFYVQGKAVGTIWAIAHNERRKFDAEDMRQLVSLGSFASSAYQVVAFLDALEERDEELRQSCEQLEQSVFERTSQLLAANKELEKKITERDRAEEALRDSEEQWKAAFESNPVMYFMVDRTGTTLSVNAFGADLLGYKRNELVGQSVLNVFHEAHREQVRKHLENCFENLGRTFKWEASKVRKDGTVIWVRETANALLLKNRPVLLVVCEDITDRKRAEEAARRSEKQLRDVFETIPAMVWSTLADGTVDFMNHRWQEVTGLPIEQALGWNWATVLHPDDREKAFAGWESVIKKGQAGDWENRVRGADGEYRSWFIRQVPLRDEHGKVVKWYGTAIDIEDRKRAEEAVHRSEKQLRDLIETIPAMAFVTRADGSNEFVSRKWIEFSGLSAEQSAGSGWEVTLHPDDVQQHLAKWRAAWTTGKPFESEARHRDAHGNYRWLLVRAVPLRDERGNIVKWYGAAIDVEDRKRAEDQVRRSEAYLAEAQRLTHTGSWYWNVPTGEVSWSREYCGIFGFDFEKDKPSYPLFIGRVHPEDRPKVEQVLWADVREKRDFDGEYRLLLPDGSIKYLHSLGKCSVGQSGEVEYIGAVVDITERKKAEEALRASEQLARSHVEVMMRSLDVLATGAAPEKFTAEMLRTIGQRLHARGVLLWLRDPKDNSVHLRLVIEDGRQVAPHQDHPFVKDPHLWERNLAFQEMLFTKGPVVCDDLERDSRIGTELRKYLMKRGRKRFLAIPMFVLGEMRGFIGIQHSERGAYRAEEVELAQALAHHVMIATHEAELGEQRRHAVLLEERTRMARDIHDTLAQGFTGVIVQLDTAVEALRDEEPEAAAKHIRGARDLARDSLTEARRSVHALRPQALEKAEFADALRAIITNTTTGTSLRSDFQVKGDPRKLQSSVEENLLHIGQEALTNALRHARATKFQARLFFDSQAVRLELRDNGKGFVVDEVNGGGFGLIGMKERAQQIGATLAVTSKPGAGTTITAVSVYQEPVAT